MTWHWCRRASFPRILWWTTRPSQHLLTRLMILERMHLGDLRLWNPLSKARQIVPFNKIPSHKKTPLGKTSLSSLFAKVISQKLQHYCNMHAISRHVFISPQMPVDLVHLIHCTPFRSLSNQSAVLQLSERGECCVIWLVPKTRIACEVFGTASLLHGTRRYDLESESPRPQLLRQEASFKHCPQKCPCWWLWIWGTSLFRPSDFQAMGWQSATAAPCGKSRSWILIERWLSHH